MLRGGLQGDHGRTDVCVSVCHVVNVKNILWRQARHELLKVSVLICDESVEEKDSA